MDEMSPSRRRMLQGLLALPLAALLPNGRALLADDAAINSAILTLHGARGPQRLSAELAVTNEQRRQGLMDRESLAADAGMLFVYRRPTSGGFWMYRTRIPLDIAFIDADGRIGEIHTMQPCASDSPRACPQTRPDASYRAALEVNAGYFAEHGVGVGDCVSWPGDGGGQCG